MRSSISRSLPTATIADLRARAELVRDLRAFLWDRGYWEVETPIASQEVCVDRHLEPIAVGFPGEPTERFLQTSPEFGMKRLLAAGSGSIFQVSRVFRADEAGPLHNPEFTMLEWYRVGVDHHWLMDEVAALVRLALPTLPIRKLTYRELFNEHLSIDPLRVTDADLRALSAQHGWAGGGERDELLDFLFGGVIQSRMSANEGVFVHDFPASMAALARIRLDDPPVAERFELLVSGIELCNGYHELTDADELLGRQRLQNADRIRHGRRALPTESLLIEAMRLGLPACAGVALGVDRLALLALCKRRLSDVIAFPFPQA